MTIIVGEANLMRGSYIEGSDYRVRQYLVAVGVFGGGVP